MACIWITGLSGAGKSTVAQALMPFLQETKACSVLLDGDVLRDVFGAAAIDGVNHSREGRVRLAMRYAYLCKILSQQGLTVVIATISMFAEVHSWNRKHIPGYFEVYLRVPLEELRRRDPKLIYSKYDSGEIKNVAGLDLKVDEPTQANFISLFDEKNDAKSVAKSILHAYIGGLTKGEIT
jgi:adenylylsulfate kinase